jgi:hypothetical protein
VCYRFSEINERGGEEGGEEGRGYILSDWRRGWGIGGDNMILKGIKRGVK